MSRLFRSLLVSLIALTAAPAYADPIAPAAVSIRSDDLDLNHMRDAQLMLHRLEGGADQVCGQSIARTYPSQRNAYRSCRASTLAAAVSRLGADQVSALYAERYGAELRIAHR